MRPAKKHNQPKGEKSKDSVRDKEGGHQKRRLNVTTLIFFTEENYCGGSNSRLCGNLTQLNMNAKSAETVNNHVNLFKVYGKVATTNCSI